MSLSPGTRIGRDDVRQNLDSPDRTLVDLRSTEEFVGERVAPSTAPFDHGAERGGHIPGAQHLYYERLLQPDGRFRPPAEIVEEFRSVGAESSRETVTYCRLSHRASLGWFALTRLADWTNVRVYDGSWTEWGLDGRHADRALTQPLRAGHVVPQGLRGRPGFPPIGTACVVRHADSSSQKESDMTETETLSITSQDKNLGVLSHLAGFVMFIGIPSVFGPLAIWLFNRDKPHVEHHAREALNFNISMTIYAIVSGVLILAIVGIILLPAVFIAWFVLSIIAAVKASNGEPYEYPFTIRFVS